MGKEKKEIGMQKLIELLNEYERERVNHSMIDFIPYGEKSLNDLSVAQVISKKYGFIKWLVENDKIDTDPIRTRVKRVYVELEPREFTPQDFTDRLIMLLSISNSPIEDLLLYLK